MQELVKQRGKQLGLMVEQAAQRPSPTGRTTPLVGALIICHVHLLHNP